MKKIIYTILGLSIGLTMFSCSEDWLDLEPTASISEKQAFSTDDAFNAAVMGVYYNLQSYRGFGNYCIEAGELRGDDIILKRRNNWRRFKDLYTYSYIPSRSSGNYIFLKMYEVIEACNAVLDAEKAGSVSLVDEIKNPLLAETRTLRALAYFQLVRSFCKPYTKDNGASPGIPVRTSADVSIEKGRGTVKEVYDLMLEDLNFAVANLKNTGKTDRVGLTFAQGLLARVYMTMGDNDNAIKYANLALEGAPALSPAFYDTGVSQANPSVIFALTYTKDTFGGYMSYCSFHDYGWADAGGYGTIGISENFYAKYDKKDLRQNWFVNRWVYENELPYKSIPTWTALKENIKDKATYIKYSEGYKILPKGLWDDGINGISEENLHKLDIVMFDNAFYRTVSMYGKFPRIDAIRATGADKTTNAGTANLGNVPMMRTPELYLMLAECYAMKGDNAMAKKYLQDIQSNANAELFAGSDAELLEAIRLERRKELVGEGFRLFDIIRRGEIIERTNYWGPKEYAKIDPTLEDSKVYFPIPQKVIDANPKISPEEQNPGY